MKKAIFALIGLLSSAAAAAPSDAPEVAAILKKNAAARGGMDAWRKVETMAWIGYIESERAPAGLPFILEMKRPDKTRFEIMTPAQHFLRVFDGNHGWKQIPAKALQPYSMGEVDYAREESAIEWPTLGREEGEVSFDKTEEIDGKKAYRLKIGQGAGASRHVWIDAKSFLDIQYDRPGPGTTIRYRDFRPVEGLMIPFAIESGKDRILLSRVVLNPPLDDKIFSKPEEGRIPRPARR